MKIRQLGRTGSRKTNAFHRNVALLVTGTGSAQMIAAIASPVLTRVYTPKEFGLLAVFVSIVSVLVLWGSLQYNNAVTLPSEEEEAANLVVLCFLLLMGMCVVTTVVLRFVRMPLFDFLNASEMEPFFWLIPCSFLGVGSFEILNRWAMRKRAFNFIARTKLNQGLGMVCTQVSVGLVHAGPFGLLLGDAVGRAGGSGTLARLLFTGDSRILRTVSIKSMLKAAGRYKRFPLFSSWSNLMHELSEQLPSFILANAFGTGVLGWFMLGQRLLGIPLSLIGYSVSSVYMAEASALKRERNDREIAGLYWWTVKNMFVLSVPFLGLIFLLAPAAVSVVFGTQWNEVGTYLRLLIPMYLVQFPVISVSTTLYVLERQELQLLREGWRILLLLAAFFLVKRLALSPVQAVTSISVLGSIAFLGSGAISWWAIKCRLKESRKGLDA